MTTLSAQTSSIRPVVDPALDSWRFLWVPLASAPVPAPSTVAEPVRLPPPAPLPGSAALTIVELRPERYAQAALPAIVAAYRQDAG